VADHQLADSRHHSISRLNRRKLLKIPFFPELYRKSAEMRKSSSNLTKPSENLSELANLDWPGKMIAPKRPSEFLDEASSIPIQFSNRQGWILYRSTV
jgi:hypothetical protein